MPSPHCELLEDRRLFGFGIPTPDHVVVVIESSRSYDALVGNSEAPYFNQLVAQGTVFDQSLAAAGAEQPNYIALFSGSQQGVTTNDCPQNLGDVPNLGTQLFAAGREFAQYSEGLPRVGFKGCSSGNYVRIHNPVADFSNLPKFVNQPFSSFPSNDFSKLPDVSFVVPDQTHNMGVGSVAAGDDWLEDNIKAYADWAQTNNSLLIVTFDQGSPGDPLNRLPTLFVGPMVGQGVSSQLVTHYGVLRTIEEMYGLAPLTQAASATPITGIWDPVLTDTTAPEVDQVSAPTLRRTGLKYHTFSVRYSDDVAVAPASMDDNDVVVTGPGGFSRHAELVRVNRLKSGPLRTATYRVKAPGGSRWTTAANGIYTIAVRAGQVSDTAGNFVAAGEAGEFRVEIPGTVSPGLVVAPGVMPFSTAVVKDERDELFA